MSDTTADDRDDAAPIAARPHDSCASYARPLGFVGLGDLGMASAIRLANRFPLLGCDQDPARLSLLVDMVERDIHVHTTPVLAELAERCDVIAVLRPTAADAKKTISDLAASVRGGTMLLDLGASHPAETRRLAAELSDRSVHLLDAALLGTELAARDGSLTILVGGAASVLGEAEPYLAHLGTIIRTGPIGTGHTLAALLGAAAAAGPDALEEARALAEKSGLPPALLDELMASGAARPTADSLEIAATLGAAAGLEVPLISAALSTRQKSSDNMPDS